MHKIITLLFFLAFSTVSFSQTVTIKGKVTDSDDFPLESATVYLSSVKDSTVIDYTISNKNGNWELRTRKITQPVFLKISYTGLADYRERLESADTDRDFGTLKLADKSTELGELVIESEIPPIRIKSDTLEFNASSFKVRPDANVEALLKQLPGVEIDEEGKITVNGKEVNQILVNGQPFFDKDGKIALQNLPADIIDKVQVTDTKTKEQELSGQPATGNNSSINLTIQEDKNKGMFGKFMGGFGSSERYESSVLFNWFKDKRKISVLASSNNINSTGFSMNEIFDNMGGGRNNSIYMNENGQFGMNGMQFGSGNGITRSNMLGLNYNDEWAKGLTGSTSYFFASSETENDNRTRQTTFLPDEADAGNPGELVNNSFITESTSRNESERFSHNLNTEFEFKIDSTSSMVLVPRFVKGTSKVKSTSRQASYNFNDELLNESDAFTFDDTETSSFSNRLYYYKAFKKKQRAISGYFNNENKIDDAKNFNRSTTLLYEDSNNDGIPETTADIRDQQRNNRIARDEYKLGIEYFEPIMDSLRLKFNLEYTYKQNVEDRKGYDFDAVTQDYSALNQLLTNYLTSRTNTVTPTIGINIEKDKFSYGIELGTAVTKFDNFSTYLGTDYSLNRDFVLPSAHGYANMQFGKSKSLWASYDYYVEFPEAREVLPVEDLSNPLYIYRGNPNLDPNKYHNMYVSFRDYDYATRSGWSLYLGGNYYDSQVISSTTIETNARRNTTYENVADTYNTYLGGNWNKSIKKEAHTFRYGLGISANLNAGKGFTNGVMYEADEVRLTPRVNFTYQYGELVTINPTYSYSYRETNFSNYIINSASNFVHKVNLQTTTYWPKHVVFGNDFAYTYNSNIADGFRKDFFLWNTSIGYNFLGDKLLFKVKVYDLLNQNLSATRTISPTTIRDEENTVLKRYVMFSLTYKLQQFGGKDSDKESRFWFW